MGLRARTAIGIVGVLSWALAGPLCFGQEAAPLPQLPSNSRFRQIVQTGESLPRLHSLLVSHHGQLVLERYFNGYGPTDLANVKSVSKSLISALVGIAIEDGYIHRGLKATVGEYFPGDLTGDAAAEKAGITVEDLLTMRAGLRSTSNGNYGKWVLSKDWVRFALEQPLEAQPGRQMLYSTADTHLLSAMLTKATGRSTLEFARQVLADPLGFRLAAWPRGPGGIYFGGNNMELTPRQLVAFGELYLSGGRLGERQIIPADWVAASLRPRVVSPVGKGRYYGYGWWVCSLGGHVTPQAWGYGGQFIVLVPDLDLVIVTTSSSQPGAGRWKYENHVYRLIQRLIRLVGAAA